MKTVIFIAFLALVGKAHAQSTSPIDTGSRVSSSQRPLPPSILAELRRSQKNRTLIYRDTIRGSDLTRQHFNDSLAHEYADSSIAMYDTAVSLPHKEWLDSILVEIPELSRFGSRVHFNYPASIMTETDLAPVPFDSTLLERMNPVIRENLPFFDQSPMPMPLLQSRKTEAFVEAGLGNVYLPMVGGWFAQSLSPRTVLEAQAKYRSLDKSASSIYDYTSILANIKTQLGEDPAVDPFHSVGLGLNLGYDAKSVGPITGQRGLAHAISQLHGGVMLQGDASDQFHYEAVFTDREFADNLNSKASESSQDVALGMHYDPYISHFRLIAEAEYAHASLSFDSVRSGSDAIDAQAIKALFGRRKGEAIEWYGGVEYLKGTDATGEAHSLFSPIARIRIPFNPRWEFGASYEPQIRLATLRELLTVNPFYAASALTAAKFRDMSVHAAIDSRSATIDKFNIGAFMNYALSTDDALRVEARVITREQEPIFEERILLDSLSVFTVSPKDTRRLEISVSGNFLLFERDVLTGSVEYHSATIAGEDRAIPFEPNLAITAAYHLNSLWESIQPQFEFHSISRPDRTLSFVNVGIDADIMKSLSLHIQSDNILGSPSDFWPGYPECPRSFWATVRYSF
jgi:hypothetical protein